MRRPKRRGTVSAVPSEASENPHLYEADKVRINNEAKVRTAAEQPNFAEREFEKWRATGERHMKDETFVDAWAKVAWLAEGRMIAMGRELARAQARIGRQRKANRELLVRYRQMEKALCEIPKAYEWYIAWLTIGSQCHYRFVGKAVGKTARARARLVRALDAAKEPGEKSNRVEE
jgi:hypothetical protein